MCLIIEGKLKDIAAQPLERVWKNNPHGAGLLVFTAKKYKLTRHVTLESLRKELTQSKADNERLAVLHFRYATHGSFGAENIHPFAIDRIGSLLLFHNGMLCGLGNDKDSDTADLANILTRVPNKIDKYRLLEALASSSRFLVADFKARETVKIGDWHEHGKLWHSNTQLVPVKRMGFLNERDAWIQNWKLGGIDA